MKHDGSNCVFCKYTAPDGAVHNFTGPDCWERAEAFKARYETKAKEGS
jgi:hypothetical protein